MKTLIAAAMILVSAQAFAQNPLTTTQNPPAGRSSESTPNTTGSLPKAGGTEKPTNQPGSTVGGVAPAAPIALQRCYRDADSASVEVGQRNGHSLTLEFRS